MILKVVGGFFDVCLKCGVVFYEKIIDQVVLVLMMQIVEMVKLLENIYCNVNIGLVNEMKIVCEQMGVDIYEVINVVVIKFFGFKVYYFGLGVGGYCIFIDFFYLIWKVREFGLYIWFIELVGEINQFMLGYVVECVVWVFNEIGKFIKDLKIFVFGIVYKKNVDDMWEFVFVEVMELLREYGVIVLYLDLYVFVFFMM